MTLLLPFVPLTAPAFAPYGHVLDAQAGASRAINSGTSWRVDELGHLDLTADGGRPVLALFRAQRQDPACPWLGMERHRLGTQSFVPLMGARCLVLVALGPEAPDMRTVAAFEVGGHQGFTLNAGVWHHPLIALDDGDFIVVERVGAEVDCDWAQLETPLHLVRA